MKKILLYSSDFILSYSFLIYLQNKYNVTCTPDIKDFENIIKNALFDIVIMDAEPTNETETICRNIHRLSAVPIVLFYVYNEKLKDFDERIRNSVKNIFYKPFDLHEVADVLEILAI
jgi:DNA-binding response OmpR family regulator